MLTGSRWHNCAIGVRGSAGLFPCEGMTGMTSLFANEQKIAFGVNLELVAKLSENSNF